MNWQRVGQCVEMVVTLWGGVCVDILPSQHKFKVHQQGDDKKEMDKETEAAIIGDFVSVELIEVSYKGPQLRWGTANSFCPAPNAQES